MTRRRLVVAVAALVAGAGALTASLWLVAAGRPDSARIALGQQLYAARCATCHGADLAGQPNWQNPSPEGRLPAPPHDAGGHTWHHGDAELFTITKQGMAAFVPGYESDMPAFEGVLDDSEIRAVLAFIKSTWPRREREYQAARNRGGSQ